MLTRLQIRCSALYSVACGARPAVCQSTKHVALHSQPDSSKENAATASALCLTPGKLHCWYADHQEVILPDGHRFPMHKYRATRELLQSESQMADIAEFYPSPPVPMEDLLRVHTAEYVHRFTSGQLLEQDMRVIGVHAASAWRPCSIQL